MQTKGELRTLFNDSIREGRVLRRGGEDSVYVCVYRERERHTHRPTDAVVVGCGRAPRCRRKPSVGIIYAWISREEKENETHSRIKYARREIEGILTNGDRAREKVMSSVSLERRKKADR